MKDIDQYTPENIQAIVESAGRTLMMMPAQGTKPQGYASTWPEIKKERDFIIIYDDEGKEVGYEEIVPETDPIWPKPNMKNMTEFNIVLDWLLELRTECNQKRIPHIYSTVRIAMLHHPLTHERYYKWTKIVRFFGRKDYRTAQKWYEDGIQMICNAQNKKMLDYVGKCG